MERNGPYFILRILILFGFLGVFAGLLLAFLSQRYWFARAWGIAGRIARPEWRKRARGTLIATLVAIGLATAVAISQNIRGGVSHGSRWSALCALWLVSSILSYLFIKSVAAVEWLWLRRRKSSSEAGLAAAENPAVVAASGVHAEAIDHSRRYFFQAAGVIAGAVPFVTASYGFVSERFRFYVREVEIPIANLPPGLDGLRVTQISDIHIGSYMPAHRYMRTRARPPACVHPAAPPEDAVRLYEEFVRLLRAAGVTVATGVFQAHMQVEYVNDGPVTILLDSEKQFEARHGGTRNSRSNENDAAATRLAEELGYPSTVEQIRQRLASLSADRHAVFVAWTARRSGG